MNKNGYGKILKLNKEDLKASVLKKRKKYYPKLPSNINKLFDVDQIMEDSYGCYRIVPREKFNGTYIFYLYGGGMCHNIRSVQWDFIVHLALRTGTGLFVPMYPLAPENCCRDVFKMLTKCYNKFAMGKDVKKIVLLGDYSGAGLALSLAMLAWEDGMRKPDQMILVSPSIDTEFFDTDLEKELLEHHNMDDNYFYNDVAKDFINTFWVKDYAVRTEYTSPFYGDYTDICDDVVIFSGTEDMLNCYARAFYNKAKAQGVNIRFFEFDGEKHDFMLNLSNKEQKKAFEYLVDVINNTYNASIPDIFPLKMLSGWTKKYPETIKDEWANKFVYDNKFDFSQMKKYVSEYHNIRLAATYAACDKKVAEYLLKFPNCTIVNLGCRLDNMFDRLDNGRIRWYSIDTHNIMSIRRSMYGVRKREKTIGRSISDFSWVDEIKCRRNQGLMFVCNDMMTYMTLPQIKEMIDKIWERFPGSELVFTTSTTGATLCANIGKIKNIDNRGRKKMSINDARRVFGNSRTDFKIVSEEPVFKYLVNKKEQQLKLKTRVSINYNIITYNHKIIHVKLGSEAYDVKI